MSRIRVSAMAKTLNIPSVFIVQELNLVHPQKKHSASSWIPTGIDSRMFYQTVLNRAVINAKARNRIRSQ